jgi:methylenetetrahydrofolate reductase (NADPH)
MINLELVPRDIPTLIQDSQWALNTIPDIGCINVPDVLRIDHRSYDTCIELVQHNCNSIPHIRIIDFSEEDLIALCQKLYDNNVNQVLLISGDPPPNALQPIFQHHLPSIITSITSAIPNLTVYAGCDPYRQNFQDEINYCNQKIEAGAKGLFTQPIFNPHLAAILLEQCNTCEWFIGISPVLTERSYKYWITRNKVVFSPDFKLDLDFNIGIAKDILTITQSFNQHNYLMPIKTDIKHYLSQLFNVTEPA